MGNIPNFGFDKFSPAVNNVNGSLKYFKKLFIVSTLALIGHN